MEENHINNSKSMDVVHFHIPRWNELPNLDLYLDQTVTLLEKYLQNYIGNKDEKIITKTMINNYVKAGLMKAPKKKKYNRTHIATLFVICTLKQIYSINDIYELILLAIKTTKINHAYDQFCTAMEKAIALTFAGEQYNDEDNMTSEKYLLKMLFNLSQINCMLKRHFYISKGILMYRTIVIYFQKGTDEL